MNFSLNAISSDFCNQSYKSINNLIIDAFRALNLLEIYNVHNLDILRHIIDAEYKNIPFREKTHNNFVLGNFRYYLHNLLNVMHLLCHWQYQ